MNNLQFSTEPRPWTLEPNDFDRPMHQLRWIADDLTMVAFDFQLGVAEGLGLSADSRLRELLNELGVRYDGEPDPRATIAQRVAHLIRLGVAALIQSERGSSSVDAFSVDVQEALRLPTPVAADVWMTEHVGLPSLPLQEWRAAAWAAVVEHLKTHSTRAVCMDCGPGWAQLSNGHGHDQADALEEIRRIGEQLWPGADAESNDV